MAWPRGQAILLIGGDCVYKTANEYYKEKFGCKVYKLSVDGGFTCPNRDGTISTGGCIFCSSKGSGEFAEFGNDINASYLESSSVGDVWKVNVISYCKLDIKESFNENTMTIKGFNY